MPIDLEEYYNEFFQEVMGSADADGLFVEDAFFDRFCEKLVEAGDLDEYYRTHYLSTRGLRIDGYGGDPSSAEGVLSLIIADFNQSEKISSLTAGDMNAIFKRAHKFLEKALDHSFRDSMEESLPAFGLTELIAARWPGISKIRMILISNRKLSSRVDGREAGRFQDVQITYGVWDIERLYRYIVTGHGREEIEIDLENDFDGPLTALPANISGASYKSYLLVIPGMQLAAIYDRWGARLLEQNVRVFLQAKGKVNKGIRNTLEQDPEMFFAYNNGITVTAENIETRMCDRGLTVTRLKNLQIVNGGQTTASIHAASKKKDVDLSRVFVQMKLSIVEPEKTITVVPKISEYANTQNRVNAADFFSNHPFHVRMEDFSRRIFAPSPDGSFRQSKWFYERARGQYQDARAYLTKSDRTKFDMEYPRRQVITKTDLAKHLLLWKSQPHTVSKGAQKCFATFAQETGKNWSKHSDSFNETFFRHAVAKTIIFKEVEQLVTKQAWYEGGYRANVVAYAISKLSHDISFMGRDIDFDYIWKHQGISGGLREALTVSAKFVHSVIVASPLTMRNVTEWAKQQACWERVKSLRIAWPTMEVPEWIHVEKMREIKENAIKNQKILNGIEAQTAVVNAGGDSWREIMEWGSGEKLVTPKELTILAKAAKIPEKIPNEKESLLLLEVLSRLHQEGCHLGREITPHKSM